jgi:hemin uptake protein HemP
VRHEAANPVPEHAGRIAILKTKVNSSMMAAMDARPLERTGSPIAAAGCAAGAPRTRAGAPAAPVRTVEAGALLGAAGLLRIDLDGEIYTLRLTRNHRLILTK